MLIGQGYRKHLCDISKVPDLSKGVYTHCWRKDKVDKELVLKRVRRPDSARQKSQHSR